MPHPLKNCGVFDDDDSGKAEAEPILGCASLRSSALEVVIAAAREVLETGVPAAREAEARAKAFEAQAEATMTVMLNAAKVCGGVSPASGSCSAYSASASASAACSAAGRSAMAAARMASEAVAAAVNAAAAAAPGTVPTSTIAEAFPRAVAAFLGPVGHMEANGHASSFAPPGGGGEGRGDPFGGGTESVASVGSALAAAVTAASSAGSRGYDIEEEEGVMDEVEMLSALAPLLEEIVASQRREWDLQVRRVWSSDELGGGGVTGI